MYRVQNNRADHVPQPAPTGRRGWVSQDPEHEMKERNQNTTAKTVQDHQADNGPQAAEGLRVGRGRVSQEEWVWEGSGEP